MSGRPSQEAAADPRPLTGEPLSLDLLNTRWIDQGTHHDLLESVDGLAVWLRSSGLADRVAATPAALDALREVREALWSLAEREDDSGEARAALNRTLGHGWIRRSLGTDGPESEVDTDPPGHLPAWLAAADYLRLLEEAPARIRRCANPDCVLHFYDVSKNGTRRWCSMAGCGNRAKASRHYQRRREPRPTGTDSSSRRG
ncbi:CGNR zinc finger domain-containing protein [Amycolatopsis granulosa]|uniref:CGNR zinc finger domain-containing protein n=1 Tax=Amycolatopsis granulosa TaxID=185684 RepID=UPI00141FDE0E|nr:putative RNA-binding Zn ribbon-like protein [Amycolatopsis granulosa]